MRRFLKALLILIIGLPVMAAAAYWYLQQNIAAAGVSQLQLDFNRLTLHSASFHRVRFQLQQDGAMHQVDLQNVDIRWRWPRAFKPQLQYIELGRGKVIVGKPTQPATADAASPLLIPGQWQLPDWLPEHIKLADTELVLPCPAGQCPLHLTGYLRYHASQPQQISGETTAAADNAPPAYWQSQFIISELQPPEPDNAKLFIDLRYQPTPQPSLELTVQQAQQLGLSLKQHIDPDSLQAMTELVLAVSPPSPANQRLLQQWGVRIPEAWIAQFQQPVQLYSKLNWQLPADGDLSKLLSSHDVDGLLIARAPDPFYLPQLGLIKGEINVALSLKNQLVEQWKLNGNATISELELPGAVTAYDLKVSPLQLRLSSETTTAIDLAALPLQLQLSSSGENRFELNSDLSINLTASPRLTISHASLSAAIAQLTIADNPVKLSKVKFTTQLSGYWQTNDWQINLQNGSQLSMALQHPHLTIDDVTIKLADTQLRQTEFLTLSSHVDARLQKVQHTDASIDELVLSISDLQVQQRALASWQLTSNLDAHLKGMQHPVVKRQNWRWQTNTEFKQQASQAALTLQGSLGNDSGFSIAHQLTWQDGGVNLNWQLADLFMLASNPLANTFTDWPTLLELNRGRLGGNGQLSWRSGKLSADSQLQLRDLAGIYDRSLFRGVTANIALPLQDQQFELVTTDLVINHINHGLELGPLQLSAQYQSTLADPTKGTLALEQLILQLMGGTLSTTNQLLDLSQDTNQLVLQLSQLDIAQLLQQHPSTDIKGQGKLSGKIPLTFSQKGVTVTAGRVAAEAPGGKIQYQSAASSGMAATNQSMQTVFRALEDFHFSVLASEVSYDTSGKLLLALNLKGLNPALQQGRAINLNINLEEDLPAMITSLQLTNKLNDTITKRVQQYIKQKQAAAAAAGERK
ncbi:YdbH domain-containing protein [Arsukibacterium sp.]|uniref:intermembrane phospholipid transport protein YdbH family protein n=1 Tax=Arsukibacterium sp. TaxID=1977258 RepID=UPI003563C1B5